MYTVRCAIKNGRSTSEKTRHVDIRYFVLHDKTNSGDVFLQYMCTDDMIDDILTKPLERKSFRELRNKLLNWSA